MPRKLLITDLDNTLYDWVTFFTSSFRGMIEELTKLLDVNEEQLLNEFRTIHQKYGNSEQPFAVLELPSVLQKYSGLTRTEITERLDPALHRFNSVRKRTLSLYPGSEEALQRLSEKDVTVVGHTEAILANAYWRIRTLGIDHYFKRLYTLKGKDAIHISEKSRWVDPPKNFVTVLPREERKPNPSLILDICRHEGVEPANTYYLGDSLVRDIAMANNAGVNSIWARYGTQYDPTCWSYLVKVTHWTNEDVEREKDLKARFGGVKPDYTIDSLFDLPNIIITEDIAMRH
jgi:FMN phosphatase YigB (HAD superfamily)